MRADDLLAGPRGRRACWELLGLPALEVRRPDAAHIARTVDELRAADKVSAARRILAALRGSVDAAMYWQEPEECDTYLAEPQRSEVLRPLADALASNASTAWWDTPADLTDQHVVVFADEDDDEPATPVLTRLRRAIDELTAEHADAAGMDERIDWRTVSGWWWSSPIARPGVTTTRAIGAEHLPAGLLLVEDGLGWDAATSWPVRPVDAARVLELAQPGDWVGLVRRYPLDVSGTAKRGDWWRATGRDGAWLMPDWAQVAADWDGVHVSVVGYLSTAGRALDVDVNTATVLAGWAPDTTYWLGDVLELAGEPTTWRGEDGDWSPASPISFGA
ncbi:MAG TPA: hypothetical protein VE442_19275 [Jatrophihabitans sp.]|nr:hypothetical protein [Jatrophihabitans sp.]